MTDIAITGNKLAPALGDYYLGSHRVRIADDRRESENPDRPNDLYYPVPGDRGADVAKFDDRAYASSGQWWVTKNRGWLAVAGLTASAWRSTPCQKPPALTWILCPVRSIRGFPRSQGCEPRSLGGHGSGGHGRRPRWLSP